MFMNCHVLDNIIIQDQWRMNWFVSFSRKTIALVLVSFIVTNHRLAQSDIDLKSSLSLEAQSAGDWTFSNKKTIIGK